VVPLSLVLGAYVLALLQRPGDLVADTKVHLYVDPARFFGDVASAWTPTAGLGHVWAGQYGGYLFPMGPFFALGHWLGIGDWVVDRLWLGLLLAIGCWGVVRAAQALGAARTQLGCAVAGLVYLFNPYVVVFTNRTTITLLAYAALPWLFVCVHRGLRDPRGWWWPGAFALVLTSTGGGVNAAVTGWMLLAPALLVGYELTAGGVPRGALAHWLGRLALLVGLTSAWWVVPLVIHAGNGVDFLPFTEQPGTIWGTSSIAESLRLMGFWTSYIGVGFGGELRPFASHGPALLFSAPIVVAGMVVPALALLGLRWTWRARYAPFFGVLVVAGVLAMAAGFPEGTPLRRGLTYTYNHVEAVRFLRTSYKAGPLVALGIAVLGALAFARAWVALAGVSLRLGRLRRRVRGPVLRGALAVGGAALVAVAAWPLSSGRAPDRQLAFDLPAWWHDAARELDRADPNTRALVLPGQLFASYRWGQTIDAVLPVLTEHPVATRYIVPFSDLRATELHWQVDALVNQERLVPGQLAPLLDLLGVGQVVVATDGDRSRGGELGPAEVARALGRQPEVAGARALGLDALGGDGLGEDALGGGGLGSGGVGDSGSGGGSDAGAGVGARRSFGRPWTLRAAPDRLAGPVRRPPVEVRPARTQGIVRVVPRSPLTVVDGGAQGILDLAAFGDLRPDLALAYGPDLDRERIVAAVRDGAGFVIADGNRRRAFVAARLRGNTGPTLPADRDVSEDGTRLDPFRDSGPDDPAAQTVALLRGEGVRSLDAPSSPQVTQFPEHRPAAALDGDLRTAWLADRVLARPRHHLDVTFDRPRDVASIDLYPYSDARGVVRVVEIAGKVHRVRRGWNHQRLVLRKVRRLRVRMAQVDGPRRASGGAGGIRELRIPGVRVREVLRLPTVIEDALRDEDLGTNPLTYLLQRTTADAPALQGRRAGQAQAGLLRDAQDPEARLRRSLRPPAARRYTAEAWVSVDPAAADDALDAIAAPATAALGARSSSRFEGRPRHRASGAFDGGTGRAWIGEWARDRGAWISWRTPGTVALQRLRLVPAAVRVRRPTRVRLRSGPAVSPPVAVRADGFVRLPEAIRGRRFRLEIVEAAFPPGTPAALRSRRAVGIGELRGAGTAPVTVRRRGAVEVPCGAVTIRAAGRGMDLRVPAQDVRRFDAGLPLRAESCAGLSLPAVRTVVRDKGSTTFRADRLRLFSAAPAGIVLPGAAGRVVRAGRLGNGSREGIELAVREPSWLIYGESYARGWRATCDGRDLGAPVPMQGYANAWEVEPGCEQVDVRFAPDRTVVGAYIVSAIAIAALIAFLLVRRERRRRRVHVPPGDLDAAADTHEPWPLPRALVAGVLAAGVLGFVLALRAGVVLGPLVALILWRGVRSRDLVTLAGALLLVAVPLAHLLARNEDHGGYDTNFAVDHIAAHWIATGAVALVLVALLRWLHPTTGSGPERSHATGGSGPERSHLA
jgi:hypothetical protein